jgi:hypothetical protein
MKDEPLVRQSDFFISGKFLYSPKPSMPLSSFQSIKVIGEIKPQYHQKKKKKTPKKVIGGYSVFLCFS